MKNILRLTKTRGILIAALGIIYFAQPLSAQWWRFGVGSGVPLFTDLLFNRISVLNAEREVSFSRSDLDSGRVIVRGRAEADGGRIGRVESSLDGGRTWSEIPFNERGLFSFEFRPDLEREYRFMIRAFSTTGQVSDENDHSFSFRVVRADNRDLAIEVFNELVRFYQNKDLRGFMSLVSNDFTGNEVALENALINDFRYFDSVRLTPRIQRMAEFDGKWSIFFSFNRHLRSVKSGEVFQDSSSSSLTLSRDGGGFRLYEMAIPLIFGVSDPSEVSNSFTRDNEGGSTIVVDEDGNIEIVDILDPIDPGIRSDIREGTVKLEGIDDEGFGHGQAFSLLDYNKKGIYTSMTFGHELGSSVLFGNEVIGGQVLAEGPISSVASVPAEMDWIGEDMDPPLGRIYALKLIDGTYAVVRVAEVVDMKSMTFQYRHQRNGSPNF